MAFGTSRQIACEGLGSFILALAVIGSGIMAMRLAESNAGVALIAVTGVTVATLLFLIVIFGPISGAHFNPLVSLVLAYRRLLPWSLVPPYIAAQFVGTCAGAMAAHLLFSEPLVSASQVARGNLAFLGSEIVATFGLVLVILHGIRFNAAAIPYIVPAYVGAGFWFTSSTCFSNPALTLARGLTGTFTGIRLEDVLPFAAAQTIGAAAAVLFATWLFAEARTANAPAAKTAEPAGGAE
jgi:glycerol uptake facilitator-like aquaporin